MGKWRYVRVPPVVAWPDHQIVALHFGVEDSARVGVKITGVIERAGEAGHDADIAVNILIKLSCEAIDISAFRHEINAEPPIFAVPFRSK